MSTRAGNFPHGIEARDGGATEGVGCNATHPVVGCRGHGNGVTTPVQPIGAAGLGNAGEALRQEVTAQGGGIQKHGLTTLLNHCALNTAGNHISRSKLCQRVDLLHKALAVGVNQHSTFAAHSLRDEERTRNGKGCGVELVELHIS